MKKIDYFFIFALLIIYIAGASQIIFGEKNSWVTLICDDAYYYLGIARNIVEHGVSSFLPPFETNGYQPLWLLFLSATAFIFGTTEASLVLQAFSLSFIFVALFAYFSNRYYGFAFPAIASATVFAHVTLWGMETTMMPFFVLAFLSAKNWKSRGVFSSLIFLTRLDALALIVARDCYFFLLKREKNFKHYFILIPAIISYLLINYKVFGAPVPISGLAKSIGNISGENLFLIYIYAKYLTAPIIIIIGALIPALLLTHKMTFRFKDEMAILLLAYTVICGYYAIRSGWPIWDWYSWPAMMIFFFAVMNGVLFLNQSFSNLNDPIKSKWSVLTLSLTTSSAFFFTLTPAALFSWGILSAFSDKKEETYAQRNLDLVTFIEKEKLPRGTFFAMGDRAGSFGFFLGNNYKFLHTEGLVGPRSYYEYMKRGAGDQFLRENKIDYLIAERDRFFESGDVIGVAEPVQGLSSHTGPYLLCFNKSAIVLNQTHLNSQRYMFDFSKEVSCPQDITNNFENLRKKYGGLRNYALYSEYLSKRGFILSFMNHFINIPAGW